MPVYDPYDVVQEAADSLWDLYQEGEGKDADSALAMYNTLENIYLEPIRRSRLRANTKKYEKLAKDLQAGVGEIAAASARIEKIGKTVKKIAEYAAIFDKIVSLAAKLLV